MFRLIRKKTFFTSVFLLSIFSTLIPQSAQADILNCSAATDKGSDIRYSFDRNVPAGSSNGLLFEDTPITATLSYGSTSATGLKIMVVQQESEAFYGYWFNPETQTVLGNGSIQATWDAGDTDNGTYDLELWGTLNGSEKLLCTAKSVFTVTNTAADPLPLPCESFSVSPTTVTDSTQGITASFDLSKIPEQNRIQFKFIGAEGKEHISDIYYKGQGTHSFKFDGFDVSWLKLSSNEQEKVGVISVDMIYGSLQRKTMCQKVIKYDLKTNSGTTNNDASNNPPLVDAGEPFALCKQAGSANQGKCEKCFNEDQGIWTAVGCIPFANTTQTVRALLTIGLGLAGTVVVLMTLAGAFMLSTSRGEPQRVEEARSLIISAVSGILFLIFSVTILRFIGVSILQLPGFS